MWKHPGDDERNSLPSGGSSASHGCVHSDSSARGEASAGTVGRVDSPGADDSAGNRCFTEDSGVGSGRNATSDHADDPGSATAGGAADGDNQVSTGHDSTDPTDPEELKRHLGSCERDLSGCPDGSTQSGISSSQAVVREGLGSNEVSATHANDTAEVVWQWTLQHQSKT